MGLGSQAATFGAGRDFDAPGKTCRQSDRQRYAAALGFLVAEPGSVSTQGAGSGLGSACASLCPRGSVCVAELVESLRDAVCERWDRLDVLIHHAGVAIAGTVADIALDDWRWVMIIDLFGVVRGMKVSAPMFRRQRRGHVLSTASFPGIAAKPGIASYGVTKPSVIVLSETFRAEMAPFGVKVSVIRPSFSRPTCPKPRPAQTHGTRAARLMELAH